MVIAVYCLCFRDGGKVGNSPHKRTFSFRSKHWTDSSGPHSMPREQQARKDNTHAGAEPTTSFQLQGDNTVL
ncbi:hypothetical protein GBAR_LOCUS8494 [Geodia barretti]|uniref:Uncharacterized protein n=1 Tax=Geodia barretti TaxID=519541 RepID=A0AA35RKT6_GEOBA|nr:hypothetical protein GBAR_LOCUS8494 [Geodia barretti]